MLNVTDRPPAKVGDPLGAVDTPALVVQLDALERNVALMGQTVEGSGVRLRPHAKSHKCPAIASRQVAAGAVGVCVQKVSEAEALVAGGIEDVFVSNEVVGTSKLGRLAALACRARVSVCVDDVQNVSELDQAAREAGVQLDVLVEVNVGMDRCGVEPGQSVVEVAAAVGASRCLRFVGLQAYQGRAQHVRSADERSLAISAAIEKVGVTVDALTSAGIDCPTISGAGTGSFVFELRSGSYTEIQPGSYVFMDADYARNDWTGFPKFEQSLFVLSTVMSRPTTERAVVDAGLKALSVDSGMPEVAHLLGVNYVRASDEHGVLRVEPDRTALTLGEKILIIPGHCDPTVNLHDWFVCVRNDVVEDLWPVTARGAGF